MAKIRFNLNLNNTAIRSLNDLRENFHVDEILQLHEEGVLRRWLEVWGHSTELQQVNAIPEGDPESTALELARIFSVSDTDSIRAWAVAAGIRQGQLQGSAFVREDQIERENFLEQYHGGFLALQRQIIQRKGDNAFIQAQVRGVLNKQYYRLVRENPERFVKWARENAPLALLAALMEDPLRKYVLQQTPIQNASSWFQMQRKALKPRDITPSVIAKWVESAKTTGKIDDATVVEYRATKKWTAVVGPGVAVLVVNVPPGAVVNHHDKNGFSNMLDLGYSREVIGWKTALDSRPWGGELFDGLTIFSSYPEPQTVLAAPISLLLSSALAEPWCRDSIRQWLRTSSGIDHGGWTTVVEADRKVMVLFASDGCKIRAANGGSEVLGSDEINGHFPVLDGLERQASGPTDEVYWIEVLPLEKSTVVPNKTEVEL